MTSIASTHNNSSDNHDDDVCSQSLLGGSSSQHTETKHHLLLDNNNNNNNKTNKKKTQEHPFIVGRSRGGLFLAVWVLAGLIVGGMTFVLLRLKDKDNFEMAVHGFSSDITEMVAFQGENLRNAATSFASAMTASVDSTSSNSQSTAVHNNWPFHQMNDFALRGNQSMALSGAQTMTFAPLVAEAKRAAWQDYAFEHWHSGGQSFASDLHKQNINTSSSNAFTRDDDEDDDTISYDIFRFARGDSGEFVPQGVPSIAFGPGNYAPVWQQSPQLHPSVINFDLLSHPVFNRAFRGMIESKQPVLSEVTELNWLYPSTHNDDDDSSDATTTTTTTSPHSFLLQPVYPTLNSALLDDMVGILVLTVRWDFYLSNLLQDTVQGMVVVVRNTCGDVATFRLDGPRAIFLGYGDHHDVNYNHLERNTLVAPLRSGEQAGQPTRDHCHYDLSVYPSDQLEKEYMTKEPMIYGVILSAVFLVAALAFSFYDFSVQRQYKRTMDPKGDTLPESTATIAKRELIENDDQSHNQLRLFLQDEENKTKKFVQEHQLSEETSLGRKPMADFFPIVTVMSADIVGFSAWSSVRQPSEVFTLLERVFSTFDSIAVERGVFKVETVGDCYVTVAGLKDRQPDHAKIMARFANDCVNQMTALTKRLEVILGPETGELSIRVGLNSGPVTAGVLRGNKSRFQLFGETMDFTFSVEKAGKSNRIHVSSETADFLKASGKFHWLVERKDKMKAKGKGEVTTYWLDMRSDGKCIHDQDQLLDHEQTIALDESSGSNNRLAEEEERLIGWNVDVLLRLLREITAKRETLHRYQAEHLDTLVDDVEVVDSKEEQLLLERLEEQGPRKDITVLDEVQEIVGLPQFDTQLEMYRVNPKSIVLSQQVKDQVRSFVENVASMYHNNPFHNFQHASHVTMSTVKLLARIISSGASRSECNNKDLHDHTYGITSDPLTRFACVFSALIHDVDHSGIPNSQLIKENYTLSKVYRRRSVAEQNSVDLSWDLLMGDEFKEFRRAIFSNESDFNRFRQLVVNSVMATDIMDKGLKEIRNSRWDKAFNDSKDSEIPETTINRKATIVIEHLIQASDVSHTMQHWHIYVKWNERLFFEMYKAYKQGRAENNPIDNWYKGEIGFFDFYIIPLARKLKACGVFGVSSDEYLNYATNNRREWELRGKDIVSSYVEKLNTVEG